jgi:hypothetical protein
LTALAAFLAAAVLAVLFRSPRALVLTAAAAALYFYPFVALLALGVAVIYALNQ